MLKVAPIDESVECELPSGRRVSINRFELNIHTAAGASYVQAEDGSWCAVATLRRSPQGGRKEGE